MAAYYTKKWKQYTIAIPQYRSILWLVTGNITVILAETLTLTSTSALNHPSESKALARVLLVLANKDAQPGTLKYETEKYETKECGQNAGLKTRKLKNGAQKCRAENFLTALCFSRLYLLNGRAYGTSCRLSVRLSICLSSVTNVL